MTDVLELDRSRAATWTLGRVLQVAVWDLVRFNEGHIYPSHRTIAEVLLTRAPDSRAVSRLKPCFPSSDD